MPFYMPNKLEPLLSMNEVRYLVETIEYYAISEQQLLIKDSKDDGTFPTHLVISMEKLSHHFPRLDILVSIFDNNSMIYPYYTIKQASLAKDTLEHLNLKH
eukprot:6773532-Ditylum_brightwellii.AAC.1